MQIDIDSYSGFCYGVVKTIQLAEEVLGQGEPVYCLGEIVHNEEEVNRLKLQGLVIIGKDDLKDIQNSTVLIRAHGEPPDTYEKIASNSNKLREGTCPIVLQLQKKIRLAWDEMKKVNGQVLIYGKQGHAEVTGLAGQTDGNAIIISNINELVKIDFSRPICLFAQTTQSSDGFEQIINAIEQGMRQFFPNTNALLKITDSICQHVSKRGEHLAVFARKHDVVIFVSGKNSSNGKVLFDVCQNNNPGSYWISTIKEVKPGWFLSAKSVGICGATSTPQWLMEQVAEKIRKVTLD
jgi:4-hydroxy-3-methylbut-2-enyl diphosphate reductase